jgi:hypothetical protein
MVVGALEVYEDASLGKPCRGRLLPRVGHRNVA